MHTKSVYNIPAHKSKNKHNFDVQVTATKPCIPLPVRRSPPQITKMIKKLVPHVSFRMSDRTML